MTHDLSIVLVGSAGQGIQTIEELLVSTFKNAGYNVYATKEYMSRVRGGMNSTSLRVSDSRVCSYIDRIDLLVPLEPGAIEHVKHRISGSTKILYDEGLIGEINQLKIENLNELHIVEVNINQIAKEIGKKIFTNIVAVGLMTGIFQAKKDVAKAIIKEKFGSKGDQIVESNLVALEKGYELGESIKENLKISIDLKSDASITEEILVNGNQTMGLGAIAGGCNFIASYPMSPSTGMLMFLAQNSHEFDIVVDQVESEIAAVNKVIGAWYAGARAVATTSGGGFALMEEGISLAGMLENPFVLHLAQRPGPATGLPTRTGQEDLNLVLNAGHGEFARIIFAPGYIEQGFYTMAKAFNLADKYQIPVFVLTDQYFVDSYYNIPNLDLSKIKKDNHVIETTENYKRYQYTENGISPRGVPGYGLGLVRADSDEHDEWGHITEDMRATRLKMVEKRYFKRMDLLLKEVEMPSIVGSDDASTIIICWGSNYHVVKEALSIVENPDVAMVHFNQVYPLNDDVKKLLISKVSIYSLEGNASGQFANLLKVSVDVSIPKENQFLKYSGEPFSVEEVQEWIEGTILKNTGGNK